MNLGSLDAPLSGDDYQELAAFLDDVGLLDIEGVLGLLHAIGIAPSSIPPSRWLPLVLSADPGSALDAAEMQVFIGLLMREYNAVLSGLSRGAVIMPEAHEEEACIGFATGYVAGAELDPLWLQDEELWCYVDALAYLAGRFDLISDSRRSELDAEPNVTTVICQEMEGLVGIANKLFSEARGRGARGAGRVASPRVGRNDPCSCGSGKKYKRCCGAA